MPKGLHRPVRVGRLTSSLTAVAVTCAVSASAQADVVSMQMSGAFTSASSNVQSLVSTGFLPVRFAYVTGGASQTGPAGTQFSASPNAPQYLSIDLGFRSLEFLAGPPQPIGSGNILLKKDAATDRMQLSVDNAVTLTSITLAFADTRDFLATQNTLPSPFPSASAFSSDLSNTGWGGPAPSFGFEVFFQFNGQVAWVRGDLFPSTLSVAQPPPGIPAPGTAAMLALGGLVAARRRR